MFSPLAASWFANLVLGEVSKLKIACSASPRVRAAINETRNLAAHGDITKVLYKGRSPFIDADCFAQMYFDVWAIKQAIPKFFWHTIQKPQARLRRYYEKFGDI